MKNIYKMFVEFYQEAIRAKGRMKCKHCGEYWRGTHKCKVIGVVLKHMGG